MADNEEKNKEPVKKRSLFHKIVNIFIGFFVVLLVLIVLVIGFTQTKTFRDILREKVVEIANKELNGKIAIGKIDGTILTSLILRDISIKQKNDTIISSKKIEIKTSPLQLLLNKIYIRYVELGDTRINIVQDSTGKYNISTLLPPSDEVDTVKSEFGYSVIVSDFKINNAYLRLSAYENRNSNKEYITLNSDDIRIDSLYLSLSAVADIKGKFFRADIEELRFKPNLTNFRLYNLGGSFEITDKYVSVSEFNFDSNTSDFDLHARLDDINLFNNFRLEHLKNSPLKLNLNMRVFDFSDLSSCVSSTDIMKGTLKANIDISGKFGEAKINNISIDYLKTHLEVNGSVLNLHTPEKLFMKAHLHNSTINQADINELLPSMEIPVYKNLQLKNLAADYEGEPQKFLAKLKCDLSDGSIDAISSFDFTGEKMKYSAEIKTSKLNLAPVINSQTILTSVANIKGEGTSPKEMNTNIDFRIGNSKFEKYKIDSLKLTTIARNGLINLDFNTRAEDAILKLKGDLDFTNEENPNYNLTGSINNLNLDKIIADTSLVTDLNLAFKISGEGFDPKEMENQVTLLIDSSLYQGKVIDTTNITVKYIKNGGGQRLIRLNSNFADISFAGKYSIDNVIDVVSYQADIISNSIMKKLYEFNPMTLVSDTIKVKQYKERFNLNSEIPEIVNTDFNVKYDVDIKNFNIISLLTGIDQTKLDGSISGEIKNTNNQFTSSVTLDFDKVNLKMPSNVIYGTGMNLSLNIRRNNRNVDFNNINISMLFSMDRIFSGSDFKELKANLNLQNSILTYAVAAQMDTTIKTKISGRIDMQQHDKFEFAIDELMMNYNNYIWTNEGILTGIYTKDYFIIDKFNLVRNGSRINLSGALYNDGREKLKLQISHLDLELINNLAGLDQNALNADINLNMEMNGYLHDPIISLELNADSLNAKNVNLGFLRSKFEYKNNLLLADVKFLDSTFNINKPTLFLNGKIPADLSLVGAEERIIKGKPINIVFKSNDFYLSTFASFIPYVKNLNGKLVADLNITGTTDDINYGGDISVVDGFFIAEQNGLPYDIELKLVLARELITLENLIIKNEKKTDYMGALTGNGKINFDGLELSSIEMNITGDLKVLSEGSRGALPFFYGDLIIQSEGDWRFTYNGEKAMVTGTVLLVDTDVTYNPFFQSGYGGDNEYIYHYVTDSVIVDNEQEEFKKVIALSQKYSPMKTTRKKETDFNYEFRLKIKNEAKVSVILSQEANQKLVSVLEGQILLESGGIAQGEFKLKEESQLQFIKTLKASGSVIFESDIANPRLNITAVYTGEYIPEGSPDAQPDAEEVAVKIQLKGPANKLGENLAAEEGNIAVYYGKKNIDGDIPSPEFDAADAISFIIAGKFISKGWTAGDKAGGASELAGYRNTILGGLLSNFANSQFGDLIRNIEIEGDGSNTRFALSGRYQNLRYTLGTSYEDFSKANIKLEYPFNDRFLIRYELKDPVKGGESSTDLGKINELALRYRFIF